MNIKKIIINKYRIGFIHKNYLIFLKNLKKYLASTKTKGEIRGGGKKPWKQKGTGRARAGSIRSPLWRHGGIIFGPKFKEIKKKLNKKEYNLSIIYSFFLKKKNIILINTKLLINNKKTKFNFLFFKNLNFNLKTNKYLLILNDLLLKNILSLKNLSQILIIYFKNLNLNLLLNYNKIILDNNTLLNLILYYGKYFF